MLTAPSSQTLPLSTREILIALDPLNIKFFTEKKEQLQQFVDENPKEMNQILTAIFDKCPTQLSYEQAICLVFLCHELDFDFSQLTITYDLAKRISFMDDPKTPLFLAMLICGLPWFACNEFDDFDEDTFGSRYSYENDKAAQYREHKKIYKLFFRDYHLTLEKVKDLTLELLLIAARNQCYDGMLKVLNFTRPSSIFSIASKPTPETLDLTGGRTTTSLNTFAGINRLDGDRIATSDSGASAYQQQQMVETLTPALFPPAPKGIGAERISDVVIQEYQERKRKEREKQAAEHAKREKKLDDIVKVSHPFVSMTENGLTLIKQLIQEGNLATLQWLFEKFSASLKLNGQALYDMAADLALGDNAQYGPIKEFIKKQFDLKVEESAKPLLLSTPPVDFKDRMHTKVLLGILVPGKENAIEKYFKTKIKDEERTQYYNALADLVKNDPQKKGILEKLQAVIIPSPSSSDSCSKKSNLNI